VRQLSAESHGNATGVGMADAIHRRLLARVRREPTYVNALTSGHPTAIRTPIHFRSDFDALSALCPTVGYADASQVRIGWIANTLALDRMAVSANLLDGLGVGVEIVAPPRKLEFDERGDLAATVADLFLCSAC
jgi:hypothetical protein